MTSIEVLQNAAKEQRGFAESELNQASTFEEDAKRCRGRAAAHLSNAEALEKDIARLSSGEPEPAPRAKRKAA